MLPLPARSPPLDDRTLGDQQRHQTSIQVQPNSSNPQEIRLEKIAQEAYTNNDKNYTARLSKERYSQARASLPTGNFDWTEYKPRGTARKEKERREWSWKQRLLLAILILLIAAGGTYLAVRLLSPKEKSLHERSVEPQVPTFYEMSGLMNAPKLQPLVQVDKQEPAMGSGHYRHLLRSQ